MNKKIAEYAEPDRLVDTDWLADNLDKVVVVESDEDVLLYETGHIPGAVKVDWHTDLNDPIMRDYLSAEQFAQMCEQKGISADDTIVFYGDKSNWWAAYAAWVFSLYGHQNWKLLDGGRDKWIAEQRPLTRETVKRTPGSYPVPVRDDRPLRAYRDQVREHIGGQLVDVRSPKEYTGELTHMDDYPQEGALRGGHIPTARSVPWAKAAAPDGTFLPVNELRKIYLEQTGFDPEAETIVYCRIGERSSHTWFVMRYLLGMKAVRNYDGSWTEWGNLVGMPIAVGQEPGTADYRQ